MERERERELGHLVSNAKRGLARPGPWSKRSPEEKRSRRRGAFMISPRTLSLAFAPILSLSFPHKRVRLLPPSLSRRRRRRRRANTDRSRGTLTTDTSPSPPFLYVRTWASSADRGRVRARACSSEVCRRFYFPWLSRVRGSPRIPRDP